MALAVLEPIAMVVDILFVCGGFILHFFFFLGVAIWEHSCYRYTNHQRSSLRIFLKTITVPTWEICLLFDFGSVP